MPPRIPLVERIWKYLPEELPETKCWHWQGSPSKDGYPRIRCCHEGRRTTHTVHRLVWEIYNAEPIPPGMVIMHLCDNRCCVNPMHLKLGTQVENMTDCRRKARGVTKISEEDARTIHALFAGSELTLTQIADRYGVSISSVKAITRAAKWRWLGLTPITNPAKGERNGNSKLNHESVIRIHSLRSGGKTCTQIARELGVSKSTVSSILAGRTWSHLHPANNSKADHSSSQK